MTNTELQEAIDRTRMWLDATSSSSVKAKDDAIYALAELQKIQCTRAGMMNRPTMMQITDEDYLAALGPCGK